MRFVAIAICLWAIPSPLFADCFSNNTLVAGSAGHSLEVDSTEPAKSFDGDPVVPGNPCVACYSWPSGFFRVSGGAPADWLSFYSGFDLFQISGPPGSQLSFTARLRVTGSVSAHATGFAAVTLNEGKTTSAWINFVGGESVTDQIVSLNLQKFPGDPFNLEVDVWAQSDSAYTSGDIEVWLEFADLPSGYAITSCQGYNVPVPTQAVTWGRVRATYR